MTLEIPGTDKTEDGTANDPGTDDKKVVEGTEQPENESDSKLEE